MNNQINLCGHVGKPPVSVEFKDTGNKVVKFPVGVKMYSSNSDKPRTLWLEVESWNGLGDRVLSLVTKGREVVLTGRLDVSTYTKDIKGEQVTITKPLIKLSSFHLCGSAPRKQQEVDNDNQLTNIS